MAFASEHVSWAPAPAPTGAGYGCSVTEDQCTASAWTPPKDWVYRDAAIGFVLSGWFEYRTEGESVLAAPGAVVFGNSGEHFNVRHLDAQGNKRLVTLISNDVLEEIAEASGLKTRFPVIALPPSQSTTRMFGWMRTVARGGPAAEDLVYPLACAALTASNDRTPDRISVRDRQRVRAAVDHIEARFGEACSLQSLAGLANLSRFHFVRVFSAVVGQSPNQYLINTRVRAAAERLHATNAPIAEVAFDVGFNDISYFYACFRATFGCTPRQWRSGSRA